MKRDMTATVVVSTMSTAMSAAALNGCGNAPEGTVPETAKKRQTDAQIAGATRKNRKDGEGSAEAASGNYGDKTIGFVGMTLDSEYHTTLANGAKIEAETKGIKIGIQTGDQHASADTRLGIIENMIANKMDGILLVPSSSDGLEFALIECKETDIPIINLDTKLTDGGLANIGLNIPFYGTNNYEGTKLAGGCMAKNSEKGTKTTTLKGIEGQTNATDRYNGFIEDIGNAVTVMAEQTASWEMGQGYTAAQSIISANPDVELFFCYSDNMDIGALRAIKEVNMQKQIQTIGFDVVSGAPNLVENGEFLATMTQYPAKMGRLSVDNMLKIFDGDETESYIDTGTEVITKDSVGKFKDYLKIFK